MLPIHISYYLNRDYFKVGIDLLKINALLVDMSVRQRVVKKYCAPVCTCGSRRNLPPCAIAHTAHAEIWLYPNPTLHALQPCHSSKQTPLCSRVLANSTLMSNSLSNIAISSLSVCFSSVPPCLRKYLSSLPAR